MQKLISSLIKAKRNFKPVARTATGRIQNREFKYATLDSVIQATEGALSEQGLVIIQTIESWEDRRILKTALYHESGESMTSETVIPDAADCKTLGANITYLRRYAMTSLLGIPLMDDIDAQHEQPTPTPPTPASSTPTFDSNQTETHINNGWVEKPKLVSQQDEPEGLRETLNAQIQAMMSKRGITIAVGRTLLKNYFDVQSRQQLKLNELQQFLKIIANYQSNKGFAKAS